MLTRAKRGLAFPPEAIMMVYHRLVRLSSIEEGFLAVQELFSILYELSKFDNARELASSAFAKIDVDSESRRILKVKSYIDAHYCDELSLEQLSDLVGMTPTAFSRYFKLSTGKNLSAYLGMSPRSMRIEEDRNVEAAVATSGFERVSSLFT